jgi:6-phosphogluconate dehydrogenase
MTNKEYDIGMVGLGTMGLNLVMNMSDHGFSVAGYNKDLDRVDALNAAGKGREVYGVRKIEALVANLRKPRAIMMLVPAGGPVDSVIKELTPLLDPGDLIIDGGNSHYTDTDRRTEMLKKQGINYLGVGISGGEKGARFGPSMMPGGEPDAYQRVQAIFEAVAAKVDGDPCVTYLGPGSAGHYVKMVHNGIEYGLMQLISESYDLMKRGLQMNNDQLAEVFNHWDQEELNGFLIEITAKIFRKPDDKSGNRLVDMILGEAHQKGTGMWTSQDAMDLQVPAPTIDAAVTWRNLSDFLTERRAASRELRGPDGNQRIDQQAFVEKLRRALYASMILTYDQGFALLRVASRKKHYQLDLEAVARIWRGGCIIRAGLLEDFRRAFKAHTDLPNLLIDEDIAGLVEERQADLREVVQTAAAWGLPVPGLMSSLAYFDGYRSAWLPANLIQAQRDFFGAHTYQRVDRDGIFHTQWE